MRRNGAGKYSYQYSFNPRTRKGCDGQRGEGFETPEGFNPRTRKGCDFPIKADQVIGRFQSTHP